VCSAANKIYKATAAMRYVFALLLLTVSIGCGKQASGPATFPVTGVVTLAGSPVEGANVQFKPTSPDLGIAGAQATTRPDGTFDVKIELDMGKTSKQGLPAGEYKVAITKLELPTGQTTATRPPKNVLPPQYATIESSPLTATVKADGENKLDFPL
jgi:hypothetical protein